MKNIKGDILSISWLFHLPTGKLPHDYGKITIFTGKITISMAMFNSKPLKLLEGTIDPSWSPGPRLISSAADSPFDQPQISWLDGWIMMDHYVWMISCLLEPLKS